ALTAAEKRLDEAMSHLDRAVALAPEDFDARYSRAASGFFCSLFHAGVAMLQQEKINAVTVVYSPQLIDDFNKMRQLRPTDYRLLGLTAMLEIMAYFGENPHAADMEGPLIEALPEETKKKL